MAPCLELTGQQHALFWLICSRRHHRTGISKYDVGSLTQTLGLPQSVIRNEIDGLIDLDLLDVSDAGLRPISICRCNRNQDRLLLNRRKVSGEEGNQSQFTISRPPLSRGTRPSGSGSLAAAVKSVNTSSRDAFYDDPEIGKPAVKRYRGPGKWTYLELAQFFGREAAWKLKAAPPNYSALTRLLKDLGAAGISKIEIHRMILIFVSDTRNKDLERPAWKVFYLRRDALLAQARRRLRSMEDYEQEAPIERDMAPVYRENTAWTMGVSATVKERV